MSRHSEGARLEAPLHLGRHFLVFFFPPRLPQRAAANIVREGHSEATRGTNIRALCSRHQRRRGGGERDVDRGHRTERTAIVAAGNRALGAAVLWKNVLLLTRQLPSCCEPPPSVSRFFSFPSAAGVLFLCFPTQTRRQHIHSLTHPSRSETHRLMQAHMRGLSDLVELS